MSSSCWQPPALTEEDGQHGCVPPGGQSRGSPCHHVAELASVGHVGLLQSLVDAIRVVGWQETQQPGTWGNRTTWYGASSTQGMEPW